MNLAVGLNRGHEKLLQAFLMITSQDAQNGWKKVGE